MAQTRAERAAYMKAWRQRKIAEDPTFLEQMNLAARKRKKKYRAKSGVKEKEREYMRKWQKANPDKTRANTFVRLHGVTRAEADAMAEAQDNRCAICHQPPTGKGHCARLHVDHCHETDKIRAMLCSNCNKALGHMKDDPERLQAAVDYLITHS